MLSATADEAFYHLTPRMPHSHRYFSKMLQLRVRPSSLWSNFEPLWLGCPHQNPGPLAVLVASFGFTGVFFVRCALMEHPSLILMRQQTETQRALLRNARLRFRSCQLDLGTDSASWWWHLQKFVSIWLAFCNFAIPKHNANFFFRVCCFQLDRRLRILQISVTFLLFSLFRQKARSRCSSWSRTRDLRVTESIWSRSRRSTSWTRSVTWCRSTFPTPCSSRTSSSTSASTCSSLTWSRCRYCNAGAGGSRSFAQGVDPNNQSLGLESPNHIFFTPGPGWMPHFDLGHTNILQLQWKPLTKQFHFRGASAGFHWQ